MDDLTRRKAILEARLVELTSRMARIEEELDTAPSQDWEDLAIEREDDEALEGIGMASQADVRRVRAALDRMAAGTYGTCTRCGAAIEAPRLEAVPETPYCQSCAAEVGTAAPAGRA